MPAERTKRTPAASTVTAVAPKRGKAPSAIAKSIIHYEGQKKELGRKLKEFELDVRQNRECGYEDQHEMLTEMCSMMQHWCKDIFKVIIEERLEKELPDAHRSLICMKGVAQKLRGSNTRAEFETEDWYEVYKVRASDGQVRYEEKYMNTLLLKLWRDILLTAIDIRGKSNEKFVEKVIPGIVMTIKGPKFGYRGGSDVNLWHILRPDGDGSVEVKVTVGTGPRRTKVVKWNEEWHSNGMKAALPQLQITVDELVPEAVRYYSSD